MALAILDTNIYIDHWERGAHDALLDSVRRQFIIRQSSVVMSELRRGARSPRARRLVEMLRRMATEIWEPADGDWWEAGKLIRSVGDAQGWNTAKRREFQNDALIALTARRHGATVVTANARDFALVAEHCPISLLAP